ncbi:MAG: hypothetical protein V1856_02605 [Candidatus Liptonbacteria bacterium]
MSGFGVYPDPQTKEDKLRITLALTSTLLVVVATVWRIVQIRRRETRPALATWVMFEIAIAISFASYLTTPQGDIISNITNTVDVFTVLAILVAIALTADGEGRKVEPTDTLCLSALGAIGAFWLMRRDAFTTNLATQIIMTIAYLPTLTKMWRVGRNTESFEAWILILLSGIAGLAIAVMDRNVLSVIYTARATILTAILLGFMAFLEFRPRNKKQ